MDGLHALHDFAKGVAKASAIRDVWRFGLKAQYAALNRRLEDLDEDGLLDVINAAHIVHEEAKRRHDEKYGE